MPSRASAQPSSKLKSRCTKLSWLLTSTDSLTFSPTALMTSCSRSADRTDARTSNPSSSNCRMICLAINPEPPVTNTVFLRVIKYPKTCTASIQVVTLNSFQPIAMGNSAANIRQTSRLSEEPFVCRSANYQPMALSKRGAILIWQTNCRRD